MRVWVYSKVAIYSHIASSQGIISYEDLTYILDQ